MTPKREFSPGITSRRPPPALHILNHCLLSTTCRELLKITQNLRNFPNCGLSSINLKCGRDTLRGRRMYPLPFLVGLVPSPVQMKRIAITNLEVQGKSGKQPARFGLCAVFLVPLWYALYIGLHWPDCPGVSPCEYCNCGPMLLGKSIKMQSVEVLRGF